MAGVTALYTPQVLALATSLARFPADPALPLHGKARAPACGSALAIDLALDEHGGIAQIGVAAQACAIGQAATAIFINAALGADRHRIAAAHAAIERWLTNDVPLPDWPGLDLLLAARVYPGRHGAMLLPWKAALDALSTVP